MNIGWRIWTTKCQISLSSTICCRSYFRRRDIVSPVVSFAYKWILAKAYVRYSHFVLCRKRIGPNARTDSLSLSPTHTHEISFISMIYLRFMSLIKTISMIHDHERGHKQKSVNVIIMGLCAAIVYTSFCVSVVIVVDVVVVVFVFISTEHTLYWNV